MGLTRRGFLGAAALAALAPVLVRRSPWVEWYEVTGLSGDDWLIAVDPIDAAMIRLAAQAQATRERVRREAML